jgi:hypothetical protein
MKGCFGFVRVDVFIQRTMRIKDEKNEFILALDPLEVERNCCFNVCQRSRNENRTFCLYSRSNLVIWSVKNSRGIKITKGQITQSLERGPGETRATYLRSGDRPAKLQRGQFCNFGSSKVRAKLQRHQRAVCIFKASHFTLDLCYDLY